MRILTGSAPRQAAAILLFLALPQVYLLPRGHIDVALSTVATAILVPGAIVDVRRLRTPLFGVLLGLLGLRLLALAWSPDPRSGLQLVVVLAQFAGTLAVMSAAVRREPDALRRLQWAYWPWVVVEIALVVLFRLLPGVEHEFLRGMAGLFAGQNTIAGLFSDHRNNVLDPAKSGGVFVNANVAAMFLGVNGLAALAVSSVTGTPWVRYVGIAALVAVPFTGSKFATILAVALPLVAYGIRRLNRAWLIALAGLACAATLLVLLVPPLRAALLERSAIWGFGFESFRSHPILGLGYGGWQAGFARYAATHHISQSFPPHDVLLAAWANTGIAGLALTALFSVLVLRAFVQYPAGGAFAAYGGAALAWILVQGLGENTDVFGEIHLIPITALLIAYATRHVGEERIRHARAAGRRNLPAPTVPALGAVHREPGAGADELPAPVRGAGPGTDPAGAPHGQRR
jgi:O-antigen ligase